MAGNSPRESAGQGIFNQVSGFNPTATNYFKNISMPFSPSQEIGALNDYTDKGSSIIKQQGAENVSQAGASAGASASSRGYGGSILSDTIAGARESASGQTNNALQQLQADRLKLLPSIMTTANQQQLQVTQGEQNADFQNIQNMFQKFGTEQGLLGSFSNTNTLGDILAILNTAGGVAGGIGGLLKGMG